MDCALRKVLFQAFVRMRVRSIERKEVGEKASNEPLSSEKRGGRRDQVWDLGRAPGFGRVWYDERNIQSTPRRALADVMATLRSIFDTKFCSPGALGGLSFGLQTFCAEFSCCGCMLGQTSI